MEWPLPYGIDSFDVVAALRRPNCDALFSVDNSFVMVQKHRHRKTEFQGVNIDFTEISVA